ncbi:MAG: Ig-like domain-containing protein [Acidobacteria bacterium]|nr:Ig-like domain-containing protein [Acidobacteriota bacterium]
MNYTDPPPVTELSEMFMVDEYNLTLQGWRIQNIGYWYDSMSCEHSQSDSWWPMENEDGSTSGTQCNLDDLRDGTGYARFFAHIENSAGADGLLTPRVWRKAGFFYSDHNQETLLRLYGDIFYSAATSYGAGLLQKFWQVCGTINDNFDERREIAGNTGSTSETNICASREEGEPFDPAGIGNKSLWWQYTPLGHGELTISTLGSSFDTFLGVYVGVRVQNLLRVAFQNAPDATENLSFPVLPGSPLMIAVDGHHSSGDVQLSWSFTPYASDLEPGSWYEPFTLYLFWHDIVQGDQDGLFWPARPATRAEVLKMAYEGAARSVDTAAPNPGFPDTQVNDWFYSYVADAVQKGFVEGRVCANGVFGFCPHEPVSRYEAAKTIHAVFEAVDYTAVGMDGSCPGGTVLPFVDVGPNAWYCLGSSWLANNTAVWNNELEVPIAAGYSVQGFGNYLGGDQVDANGNLLAVRPINRAEISKIIANAMNFKDTGGKDLPYLPSSLTEGRSQEGASSLSIVTLGKDYEQVYDPTNPSAPSPPTASGGNYQVVSEPVPMSGPDLDADGDAVFYSWSATGGSFTTTRPANFSQVIWHPPSVGTDTTFVINATSGDRRGKVGRARFEFTVRGSSSNASPTGSITSPTGTVTGDALVGATAGDTDGLAAVSVTFTSGGPELFLCGGTSAACSGTSGSYTASNIDPATYGASPGTVSMELWVEDSTGERAIADTHSLTYDPQLPGDGFTLTVIKQGDGDGTVSGDGINCPPGCDSTSAVVPEGNSVTITGSGSQFVGFSGDICYGADPCILTLFRDLTIRANFITPETFQVTGSIPANGDTGISTSDNIRITFNRDIVAGPNLDAVTLVNSEGDPVPFYTTIQSSSRRLILGPANNFTEGTSYQVHISTGAVQDLGGENLPTAFDFGFTTGSVGDPQLFISAYPTNIMEGDETTVHIWFDRPQSYLRTVSLQSTPTGQLFHPMELDFRPGEIVKEIQVGSNRDHSNFSDVPVALQASGPGGLASSWSFQVRNWSNIVGSNFKFLAGTMIQDDNNNGIFEAGEDARFRFEFYNDSNSTILNVEAALEIVNPPTLSRLRILDDCFLGRLDPDEVDYCDVDIRSYDDVPEGAYVLKLDGRITPGGGLDYYEFDLANSALADYRLYANGVNEYTVSPGELVVYPFVARSPGVGFDIRLPLVRFSTEIDGSPVTLAEAYVDVREPISDEEPVPARFIAPSTPGAYTITGKINPDEEIPESTYANNATGFVLVVAGPNQPPTLDPLGGPYAVDAGETLSFTATAFDANGDSLTFSLGSGSPAGASINPTTGAFSWTPECAQALQSYPIEILVEDPDQATDSEVITVEVGLEADLMMSQTASTSLAVPGEEIEFTLEVTNQGPSCSSGVTVTDAFPMTLSDVLWACSATAGSSCAGTGAGDLLDSSVSLLAGGTATYLVTATIVEGIDGSVVNTASVTAPTNSVDPNGNNNSASSTISLRDVDYGDAPNAALGQPWSFPTSLAEDGARHGLHAALHLGASIDGELDGQPTLAGDGDDLGAANDEDGVTFPAELVPCQDATVEVTSSGPGLLDAWIDFDTDGAWAMPTEQVFVSEPLSAGTNQLTVAVPCDATPAGLAFARFRLSTAGGLTPQGLSLDGEVEDHSVLIAQVFYPLSVSKDGTGGGTVIASPNGIYCGSDCSEDYPVGSQLTLSATPDVGSTFLGWSGDGCSGTGLCSITMDGAHAITATFGIASYPLLVEKLGDGAGLITSSPTGIDCGSDCSESFLYDTTVTLTATPQTGSTLIGWSEPACPGTGPCVVTIDAARAVSAEFGLQQFSLTVTKSGDGSCGITSDPAGIDCGTDCAGDFFFGRSVTLTATPDPDSALTAWSGACTGTGPCVVTIGGATAVNAECGIAELSLDVTKTGAGDGLVQSDPAGIDCGSTCSADFLFGTPVILAASPNSTSYLASWTGGGCSGTGDCLVTVEAPMSVAAEFRPTEISVTATGDGTGVVVSDPPGISCGTDCSEVFARGTVVELSASTDVGSVFSGWAGACSGLTPCSLTIETSHAVSASFGANCTDDVERTRVSWVPTSGPQDSGTSRWTTSSLDAHSGQRSWFVNDEEAVKDQMLGLRYALPVSDSSAVLRFYQRMDTVTGAAGGVLEYSVDGGGAWFDILEGDGTSVPSNPGRFIENGYNTILSACCSNPLPGRDAWTGPAISWQRVSVDLGDLAGHDVLLRWHFVSDEIGGGQGWWVDDLIILNTDRCPLPLFGDGFESGTTDAWTVVSP